MPRWFKILPDAFKERVCQYLLQHYLGRFLKEKLRLDQLSVDLYNGTGRVEDVEVDVCAINDMLSKVGSPLEVVSGFIESITITVPWSSLLTDHCDVQIKGLEFMVQPKCHMPEDVSDPLGSIYRSFSEMTTSMQLAEECLREAEDTTESSSGGLFDGLDVFANLLETVLTKVQVSLTDTMVRIAQLPDADGNRVLVDICIDKIDCFDEIALNDDDSKAPDTSYSKSEVLTCKCLRVTGVGVLVGEENVAGDLPKSYSPDVCDVSGAKNETYSSPSEDTESCHEKSKPVLIAKFFGNHELKLRLRQNEYASVPKVDVECFLGTFGMMVTPHQAHLIARFASGLSSMAGAHERKENKFNDMVTSGDYESCRSTYHVPLDTQNKAKANPKRYGSVAGKTDIYSDVETTTAGTLIGHTESSRDNTESEYATSVNSRFTAGFTDIFNPHLNNPIFGKREEGKRVFSTSGDGNQYDHSDTRARATTLDSQFQIHIGGLAITILHSDPLENSSSDLDSYAGYKKQIDDGRAMALSEHSACVCKYFEACELILGSIKGNMKSLAKTRDSFVQVCSVDHLRLLINGVHFNADVKSRLLNVDVSFGKAELTECLFSAQSPSSSGELGKNIGKTQSNVRKKYVHSEILTFFNDQHTSHPKLPQSAMSPHVRIHVKSETTKEKIHTTLFVHLASCETEIDVSIVDRISALLSFTGTQNETVSNRTSLLKPTSYEDDHFQNDIFNEALSEDHKDNRIDTNISTSFFRVNFRFPVADLRPEMHRTAWYARVLREEVLTLEGHDVAFSAEFSPSEKSEQTLPKLGHTPTQPFQELNVSVRMKDLHVLFSETPNQPKSFLHISQAPAEMSSLTDDKDSVSDLDYPLIRIKFNPAQDIGYNVLEDIDCDKDGGDSLAKSEFDKVWFDQVIDFSVDDDRTHADVSPFSQKKVMYNDKEVILPGDANEISEFSEHCVSRSRAAISIQLPAVNMFLESHSFFENLYNRINNDILLWTPAAPTMQLPTQSSDTKSTLMLGSCHPLYKNGLDVASHLLKDCDDDTLSYESDSDDSIGYRMPSLHGGSPRKRIGLKERCLVSIVTKIGYGKVVTKCINSDESESNHGEVLLMLENANVFYVMSYCGDPNLDYVCVQIGEFDLFHKSSVPSRDIQSNIGPFTANQPSHLDKVLAQCPGEISRVFTRPVTNDGGRHMLDLVIKIKTDEKCARHFLIATCLNDVLLAHRFAKSGQNWFEQVMQFFDAADDQVLGYEPPPYITEIHLNVTNSAIQYKPIYMSPAVNSVLTLSSFSFSSNIVSSAPKSVFHMMLDDAKFYISPVSGLSCFNQDYICVLEVNVLELGLQLLGDFEDISEHPAVELNISNNLVTIRTCTDSCVLLCSLIKHIAAGGDFSQEIVNSDDSTSCNSPARRPSDAMDDNQNENIMNLIADAMLDDDGNTNQDAAESNFEKRPHAFGNADIMAQSMFVLPNSKQTGDFGDRNLRHMTSSVNSLPLKTSNFINDDDFCIIGEEMLDSNCDSEPVINYLFPRDETDVQSDIPIFENHFEPSYGKINQLQAPKHFPTPVSLYSLNELSVIWCMYGGKDFDDVKSGTSSSPGKARYRGQNTRQGSNRDSTMMMECQLSKISARYEEYPDVTYEAKRLVLVINELEVRDKLRSSQINKFLYRFHSEESPRQTHAKAVLIKILQIRPEGLDAPTENKLRVSLQPLRLNVDQDTLYFVSNYFAEIQEGLSGSFENASEVRDTNSSPAFDKNPQTTTKSSNQSPSHSKPYEPIYFRELIFSPAVPIRLDYHGKRIDTEQGAISGLLIGIVRLNGSQLRLKRIVRKQGLLGVERLVSFLINEWATDIKANQFPSILGGVGPLYSVGQFFGGIRDFFYLPIDQYRKDGRIVRGIQRGVTSFGTSTAMSTLELANSAAGAVHYAAETTRELISPAHPRDLNDPNWRSSAKPRLNQPADIREGVSNAYTVLKQGLEEGTSSLVQMAQKEHERKGTTAAVGVVLRHIPLAVVKPLVMGTEAASNLLSGVRNQIRPDAKQQDEDKWKNND